MGQEAESDRATRVIVHIQLLTIVGTERSDRRGFICIECVLTVQAIYAVEMHLWQKFLL